MIGRRFQHMLLAMPNLAGNHYIKISPCVCVMEWDVRGAGLD